MNTTFIVVFMGLIREWKHFTVLIWHSFSCLGKRAFELNLCVSCDSIIGIQLYVALDQPTCNSISVHRLVKGILSGINKLEISNQDEVDSVLIPRCPNEVCRTGNTVNCALHPVFVDIVEWLWFTCWPSQNSNRFPMTSSLLLACICILTRLVLIHTGQRFRLPSLAIQEGGPGLDSDSPHWGVIWGTTESLGLPFHFLHTARGRGSTWKHSSIFSLSSDVYLQYYRLHTEKKMVVNRGVGNWCVRPTRIPGHTRGREEDYDRSCSSSPSQVGHMTRIQWDIWPLL